MRVFWVFAVYALIAAALPLGWWLLRGEPGSGTPVEVESVAAALPQDDLTKIVVQGRLQPRSGLINIFAPPNQRIEQLLVAVGDPVVAGQTELATFVGQETLRRQAELARARGADGRRELEQQILLAEGQLQAAENAVRLADLQRKQADARDFSEIQQQRLTAAAEKLQRLQNLAQDPVTALHVSAVTLDDQRLALEEAQWQLEQAETQQSAAREAAQLNWELTVDNQRRATQSLAALVALRDENETMLLTQSIADLAVENARLVAPIDGEVLGVYGQPGEVLLHSPLLQLGDVSQMTCLAEVSDRLISRVAVGQSATVHSPALARPLQGRVVEIGRVVGAVGLPDPNPLALVDRKTIEVRIDLTTADSQLAKHLTQLQVTVQITPGNPPDSSPVTGLDQDDLRHVAR